MTKLAALFSASTLFALHLAACGGNASASAEGKEQTCSDFCTQQTSCNADLTQADCETYCTDTRAVSKGGQEVLTECLGEQSCGSTDLLGFADCVDDGIAKLPITDEAKTFCETTASHLTTSCDGEAIDEANCLEYVAAFSDEFLNQMNECATKTNCLSVQTCAVSALTDNVSMDALQSPVFQELFGSLIGNVGGGLGNLVPGGTGGDTAMGGASGQ